MRAKTYQSGGNDIELGMRKFGDIAEQADSADEADGGQRREHPEQHMPVKERKQDTSHDDT